MNFHFKIFLVSLFCSVQSITTFCEKPNSPIKDGKYIFEKVPDISINTVQGSRHLSDFWNEKPIILTFVYSHCSGICSPFLNSLNEAIVKTGASSDYYLIVLSFDTLDKLVDMVNLCSKGGVNTGNMILTDNSHYIAATTSSSALNSIINATGFWYEWKQGISQYDHPAQLVAIKKGHIIRIIQRNSISSILLNQVIFELNGEFLRSYPLPSSNILFRCFQYDNKNDKWKLDWGFLFLFAPMAFTLIITTIIFRKKPRLKN